MTTHNNVLPVKSERGALGTGFKFLVGVMPWAIIAGLLAAAVFIKPKAVGSAVIPPALENRDQFYGLTRLDGRVLAAGIYGKILEVKDNGDIRAIETGTKANLQDIAAWDEKHLIAIGNDATVITSSNGGTTWTAAEVVPRTDIADKLRRIRIWGQGYAVITGEMGAVLKTNDYGLTWNRLIEEEDLSINDVHRFSNGDLLVVGEFGRVKRLPAGAGEVEEVFVETENSLMAVSFRDDDNGVIVGLDGMVLVTSDGGHNWQQHDVGTHDHLFDVVWLEEKREWFATGGLGRWVRGTPGSWSNGILAPRETSWHVRILPVNNELWLAGRNLGKLNNSTWTLIQ